ncbi:MAG: hypothetical protein IPK16_10050 [Anaerolineales bacterium]|nr:hypothetical protein [Anaerolineales bacterium]
MNPTSKFEYTNGELPTPAEFARQLKEASANYDPLEELLALERELLLQEQQYGLSSAEFYRQFLAGEGGDSPDIIMWVGYYEAYLRLKTTISQRLGLVVNAS